MIGISQIRLNKQENSKLSLDKVQDTVKGKLEQVASATKYCIWREADKVKIMFKKPISLQTAHKIMHNLQEKKVKIKKFSWEEYTEGPVRRGAMDIMVS